MTKINSNWIMILNERNEIYKKGLNNCLTFLYAPRPSLFFVKTLKL